MVIGDWRDNAEIVARNLYAVRSLKISLNPF